MAHEVKANDTTVVSQGLELIVREVLALGIERQRAGMGMEYRPIAQAEGLHSGPVGGVRRVQHHAEAIHLADERVAELRQPGVVSTQVVLTGGYSIRYAPVELHVANAEAEESPQDLQASFEWSSALHPEDDSETPGGSRSLDVRRAADDRDEAIGPVRFSEHWIERLERATRIDALLAIASSKELSPSRPEFHVDERVQDLGGDPALQRRCEGPIVSLVVMR